MNQPEWPRWSRLALVIAAIVGALLGGVTAPFGIFPR